MAVNETTNANASSRRLFFGTNVAVMIVLAGFVLVAVNWLAHARNSRTDLSGGLSGHRLSERTQKVLDKAGDDLRITTVYASDLPGSARKEFFPKVEDLAEEIREYKSAVKIDHITSGEEQAGLRKRIQEKFGGAAGKYDELITLAGTVWDELKQSLQPQRDAIATIINSDSWLSGFTSLANIAALIQKDIKAIDDTRREVDNLVHGEGLPRYQEANNKVRDFNNEMKKHLEQAQNWVREMDKLAKELGNPEGEFRKTTAQKLGELTELTEALKAAAGDPADPNIPADPKPVLQEYAKTAANLAEWLNAESRRVDEFTAKFPAIRQYPQWQIQQAIFVMDLPMILNSTAENLGNNSREIRRILQTADSVPLDQMQNVVRQLRQIAAEMDKGLSQWREGISAVLDQGLKIDPQSTDFLAKGAGSDMFAKPLERIDEVLKKITELPELKLDEIAQRLQQDNIVVVERGDQVKVVSFDEAWPIADPTGGMRPPDEGGTARVFDGDTAISNALLAMTQEKPVAKVVLVAYEDQPPPQMRQFQRPQTGPMPIEYIKTLREKLEGMQFKVEEWNIAEEGAMEKAPKAEEGVPLVHVFLPPPAAPPPFMRQQEQQKTFTPADAEVARKVLAENGRGLFLAMWMPPMRFGPPAEYGWSTALADWGIKVVPDKRVIRGVADRKEPGRFALDFVQVQWMQLSNFTSQPIGYPLRARRMLMTNVCPIEIDAQPPANVTVSSILEIPREATDIWAEGDINQIAQAIQTGEKETTFTKSDKSQDPPFDVAAAAENSATKSKIVVLGNGLSLRDDFLQQRVFRLGGRGARLVTDPPPIENIDLAANALYWLADRPDLIAAGPAEVPVVEPIRPAKRQAYWLATFAWAAAALVVGGAMWIVRRK